ncbi:uncharacterized protein LOC134464837 [Engraulis encrasicolus]|uniref:uncharacterized protein LOC134464837 n=1 Tax=Engraulis encrasicolus TaxID=184585 RepID=UPI002FD409F6
MATMCMNIGIFLLISMHIHFSRSLGDCTNYNFSLCWLMKGTNSTYTDRPKISVKLNDAEITSVGKLGKLTSVTIPPSEQHTIKLQYGDLPRAWTFSINDRLNTIEFQRADSAVENTPNQITLDALKSFSPQQAFACEEDPQYLQQSEDFILLLGHTTRHPLKLEAHSSSMLLVSWRDAVTTPATSSLPQTPPSKTPPLSSSSFQRSSSVTSFPPRSPSPSKEPPLSSSLFSSSLTSSLPQSPNPPLSSSNVTISSTRSPSRRSKKPPLSSSTITSYHPRSSSPLSNTPPLHFVSIHHLELRVYATLSSDTTAAPYYRYTNLKGCTPYVACVEMYGGPAVICLYTITDPDVPRNAQVTSWNTSQLTVGWDCPRNNRYSLFLLTVLHLNGTDHIVEEQTYRVSQRPFLFTADNLPPCSRVHFYLQTVCVSGMETRMSKAVMVDGNSAQSAIQSIRQSSAGPENYTLSWTVSDASLISMFKVYHQGVLQGSTLLTTHTVAGLAPCRRYEARVEAVCGASIVMNVKSLQTHTGPRAVSNLLYQPDTSTVVWSGPSSSSSSGGRGGTFIFNLSHENGPLISSGSVAEPQLPLLGLGLGLGLAPGLPYALEVWEQCHGWESPSRALLCFTIPPGDHGTDGGGLRPRSNGASRSVLDVIVPWSLPEQLEDPSSPTRLELERIIRNRISEGLKDLHHPVSVEVLAFEDYDNGTQTKISTVVMNSSITDEEILLSPDTILEFIQNLSPEWITVKNGRIYWDDPDECSLLVPSPCAPHSVCINTLDSYTCVCQKGYYDISPLLTPNTACFEKGLYTQCYQSFMVGSVAKAYLEGHFGSTVTVVLNDGRCPVLESPTLYYVRVSRQPGQCGTKIVSNKTHIEVVNVLMVAAGPERVITRHHLRVIWKCVYPRSYLVEVSQDTLYPRMNAPLDWTSSFSLVEYNSSHILEVDMGLFKDQAYEHSYTSSVTLFPDDFLYLEVALRAHNTFASDLLLEVVACWATESPDPEDTTKGILLRDGCPVDKTFRWSSVNGAGQTARFNVQMFYMPAGRPFYLHCFTRVCAPDENCTTTCPAEMLSRGRRDVRHTASAVVTAGPLTVGDTAAGSTRSQWTEIAILLTVLAGSIGLLAFTFLAVTAIKALLPHNGRMNNQ